MKQIVFLLVLLSSVLLLGCIKTPISEPVQAPAPESTVTLSTPSGGWTIRMSQSGGIMGLSRSIEISSDGKFTVTDNRSNKAVTGELAADDLSKLNELLTSIDIRSASKPNGMVCADCFVYELEFSGMGEKSVSVQLSDISLANSGYEALVDHLRGMMDKALK
jgi:hypothetical protein